MKENKFIHKIPGYKTGYERCSHCGLIARVIVTIGNDIDFPRDRHFFTLCGPCAGSMADELIEQLELKVCDISSPDNKEIADRMAKAFSAMHLIGQLAGLTNLPDLKSDPEEPQSDKDQEE